MKYSTSMAVKTDSLLFSIFPGRMEASPPLGQISVLRKFMDELKINVRWSSLSPSKTGGWVSCLSLRASA